MTNPKKSQTLHVENLGDELSVYDWQRMQMHSLNPTAAQVFELCDGETSPEQMAARLDTPHAEAVVWQSLAELEKAKLLEVEAEKPAWHENGLSRRQFLKLGAAVTAAAIVSIVVPSPAAAQSHGGGAAQIVMYSAGTSDGNLGGRAGADAMCVAANETGLPNARAFISVDAADEIRDMPGNYAVPTTLPINGPTGTTIANDWAALLNSEAVPLLSSFSAAGVSTHASNIWWSGSGGHPAQDGAVDVANTCEDGGGGGWSNGAGAGNNGQTGSLISVTDGGFDGPIAMAGASGCNNDVPVLCIAY